MTPQHYSKQDVVRIAQEAGLTLATDWTGCGPVFPLLEAMRRDGAVVLLKLDGERTGNEARPYTVMVSGGPLGDDYYRIDVAELDEGLCYVIVKYANAAWGQQ